MPPTTLLMTHSKPLASIPTSMASGHHSGCPGERRGESRSPASWRHVPGTCCSTNRRAGLDARGRAAVMASIESACSSAGVVVVTHDAEQFLPHADTVVLLRGGAVTWSGTTDALLDEPERFAAAGLEAPACRACADGARRGGRGCPSPLTSRPFEGRGGPTPGQQGGSHEHTGALRSVRADRLAGPRARAPGEDGARPRIHGPALLGQTTSPVSLSPRSWSRSRSWSRRSRSRSSFAASRRSSSCSRSRCLRMRCAGTRRRSHCCAIGPLSVDAAGLRDGPVLLAPDRACSWSGTSLLTLTTTPVASHRRSRARSCVRSRGSAFPWASSR